MTTVFWLGYGGHSWQAEQLREPLKDSGVKLITCHEYPNADVKWDRHTFLQEIDKSDIVILPARHKLEPAKSVNRLATAWSRSKACVVAPLPAYLKYVRPGVNALVAENPQEFLAHINRLHKDPALRQSLGAAGQRTASQHLDPRGLANKFVTAVKGEVKARVLASTSTPVEPTVRSSTTVAPRPVTTQYLSPGVYINDGSAVKLQIIIPHYSPDLSYLCDCVRSLVQADLPDTDVLVVSSSKNNPTVHLAKWSAGALTTTFRCYHSEDRLSFSQANNYGIKHAREDATHFLFLNDDTIVPRASIQRMIKAIGKDSIVLNPYSNCDQGWLHNDKLPITDDVPHRVHTLMMHPGMTREQVEVVGVEAFAEYQPSNDHSLVPAPFCAMYATLVPNAVLRAVGLLNETFLNGGEDADWSYRAQKLGFPTYWTRAGFIFHYGGKSRKVAQDGDPDGYKREDEFNNGLLQKKWPLGSATKRLGIWTGPAWETWDFDSLEQGIGGSEICALGLAKAAAKNGWQVTMIGDHKPQWKDGIEFVSWKDWQPECDLFDAFVASRNLAPIDWRLKTKKLIVWCHDIWILSGQKIPEDVLQRVNTFVTLSPWHREFLIQHHQVPEKYQSKVAIVPNGISTELFHE